MKKFLLLILMAIFMVPAILSAEGDDLVSSKTGVAASGQLVNIETRRATSKIDDLERRIRDLERALRSTDDRVRDLDRTVSDLRRRSI